MFPSVPVTARRSGAPSAASAAVPESARRCIPPAAALIRGQSHAPGGPARGPGVARTRLDPDDRGLPDQALARRARRGHGAGHDRRTGTGGRVIERKPVIGRMVQGDQPDWQALARVVDEDVMGEFMWMFEVRTEDRERIDAYKHVDTRGYLHLDSRGNAYVYADDLYRPVPLLYLLERVLRL